MSIIDSVPGDDSPRSIVVGEHLHGLRGTLRGELVLPRDPEWDQVRRAWQLLVDQRPVAIATVADVEDVVSLVRMARKLGLHVAPQSTGHAAGAIPTLSDTILLRTALLNAVEIDPAAGRARVGSGALMGAVSEAAARHGLAVVGGMTGTVGVTGFSLGGGVGWLARSHGLAANSVVSLDAVDAQGRRLRIDAERDSDLFWAARGGMAPVIVTALELQLHPIPHLHAGALMWPLDRAADIAHAWREWIDDVPDGVTSLVRVLRYPPLPEIPEFLRGRALVAVEAALQADAPETADLLRPLRALGPEVDTVRAMSPAELASVHGDPPQPTPAYGAAVLLSEITEASVGALTEAAMAQTAAPLMSIELRHLGGELAPGRADGGAVATIDAAGLVYAVGVVPAADARPAVEGAAAAVIEALGPYSTSTTVKNFCESPERPEALFGASTERLRRIAAAWDPERVIRTTHPIH
jgi:FAD/FMN-containing dehydrogenase